MSINTLAVEAVANTGLIPKPPSADSALAGLTKYIPTESVTLYVATVSAQSALISLIPWLTATFAYWLFVGLTPLLLLVLYLHQLIAAGQTWKVPPQSWPWWRLIASTIAFSAWALAVPGNPIIPSDSEAGGVVAGFAALLVSIFLNLLAPFFEKPQNAAS